MALKGEKIGKKTAPPPVADINVTPMVDVMLVLLIIFMVITPMLSKGVSVDLVKTRNPISMQAADKSDAVVVTVAVRGVSVMSAISPRKSPDRSLLTTRFLRRTSAAPSTSTRNS